MDKTNINKVVAILAASDFDSNIPTVIVIVGPTAVGKTAFAIAIAQHFNTQIISADSRQCYNELNIGVAKPAAAELAAVKHHFISSHAITQDVNAGVFEKYALDAAASIFKTNTTAVMVGGTGLYIKSFCEGIDVMPAIDPTIRNRMITDYEINGLEWLQKEVATKDPIYWESTHEKNNPQRLVRALEIVLATGKSITGFQTEQKVTRPFNILKVGLSMPREILNSRINERVDAMMQDGLLEEVKGLLPMAHVNALQTVGYQEIFEHLRGEISLQDAVTMIKQHTRQYAKRQMTWFTKDNQINWLELDTKS
ncbi:MAG: tRNA (adenosine(37)-N6)-dimethylallyltransferase MiaA [Bacteroidota bacterium]|jgi:tRNA dimethylallyltransferase